jgi:hypothetical protein
VGYIDNNGDYHFTPGFGRGPAGMPYDATKPMGKYGPMDGRELPYWAQDIDRRAHVLLVFFERRAKNHRRTPPGNFSDRLAAVVAKLELKRQQATERMNKRLANGPDPKASNRLRFIEAQGEFTSWATAVLLDFFPISEIEQSWDAGQCAHRHGGIDKIFVRQLVRGVRAIGEELYPRPKEVSDPPPLTAAEEEKLKRFVDGTDFDDESF